MLGPSLLAAARKMTENEHVDHVKNEYSPFVIEKREYYIYKDKCLASL